MAKSLVVVQGCGKGIGKALLQGFAKEINPQTCHILALNRSSLDFPINSATTTFLPLDVAAFGKQQPTSTTLTSQAKDISDWLHSHKDVYGIRQVWNVAGMLNPERTIQGLAEPKAWDAAAQSFYTHTLGPLRLFSLLFPFLARNQNEAHSVPLGLFYMSARVGSITENTTLGGWYSYRASKSAGNQIMRTLHIELNRKSNRQDPVPCISLHPGFVDTDMTRPFHKHLKPEQVQTAQEAAAKMMELGRNPDTLKKLGGKFYDVQNQEIIPF